MSYVSPEAIRQAKQMDLLTYLQSYQPDELVKLSGGTYCTRQHDSLKISNGKWHWFSRGIGGTTALDYLIKVQGVSFPDAVETIVGKAAVQPPVFYAPKPILERNLLLPERNGNNDAVVQYLMGRGIDREIIEYCIAHGLLYESKRYRNAVFVGYDSSGTARYAALRGTMGMYKGEASGSDKHFSFILADDPAAESVHLFESAIDAMSYATLLKMTGRNWQQAPLLSLAGVFATKRENVVPVALERFLSEHPNTKALVLHLDNDEIGRGAAQGIIGGLGDKYRVIDSPAPDAKDVNEYLVQRINRHRGKEERAR